MSPRGPSGRGLGLSRLGLPLCVLGALGALGLAGCSGDGETPSTEPGAEAPTEAPAEAPAASAELPEPTPGSRELKSPHVLPAGPDVEQALTELKAVVTKFGADPENPWAVGHAMLALGPDIALSNGEPAVDYLYSRYAQPAEISGRTLPAFPRSVGEIRVEPHTDLLLKVFTEVGVDPERVVKVGGQDFEVGDHFHHSLLTTFISPDGAQTSFDSPNDMPWGTQALAAWGTPDMQWQAFDGTQMSMDSLTKLMVHVLTSESAFMLRAMLANEGFEKKGQGIFAYTCGGAHLLQGSIVAVGRGYGGAPERDKMRAQGELLFYRFPRELEIYAKAAAEYPERRLVLLAQQLKFVGHWLESAHKITAAGLYTAKPADQQRMAEAVDILVVTVRQLKALGAFDNLAQIREQNEQLYLDLVGDSAHAVRGLELAVGRQGLRL